MKWIGALTLSLTLALSPVAASAQTLTSATKFVRGLYQAYLHGDPDYTGDRAADVFSARLQALIEDDADRTPDGDVPALDGDPICDCQDWDLSQIKVRVSRSSPGRATARVSFLNMKRPVALKLDLVSQHGQWRVDDIHSPTTPSLVKYLQDSLKDEPEN